jgi:hypothetical protein
MAFNNNTPDDLSRYSVGEIQDLSGVPVFYNAGSSKWLKSATATDSSNLSATARTNLANAGTATAQTVLVQSALSAFNNGYGGYATYPIQRISASSVSVVPSYYNGTTTVGVGVMTSAGLQFVQTGQTSVRTNSASTGTNGFVASNNTKIFSYCFSGNPTMSVYSTTNGTTWTAEAFTGSPGFDSSTSTIAHASQSQTGMDNTVASMMGWKRNSTASEEFAVFWCGARFVMIGPNITANQVRASLSADGFTFGGDQTLAILGSAAITPISKMQFYRNGNNCYLQIGAANKRYTTDGGITWAASTFAASPNPNTYLLQYNQTDPAKLVIFPDATSGSAYYSADSGATWSADRPLPFAAAPTGGFYYKGSTLVCSNGSTLFYYSTDNGVTWVRPTLPIGTLSVNLKMFADAYRFYAGTLSQAQILTSTDAITWTLITLPQIWNIDIPGSQYGYGLVSFDSNTIMFLGFQGSAGGNQCFFSLDGGVTWTGAQYTKGTLADSWNVGNSFTTPDAGGVCFAYGSVGLTSGQNTPVFKSDLTAGGAFYRTGLTAISPIRTDAVAYVRVD